MQIKTFIINAFTNKSFSGNPAGVCVLESKIDEETMQAIASELNLSETAFLLKEIKDLLLSRMTMVEVEEEIIN